MQERHSEKRRKNELLRILEPEPKVAPPCSHFLEGCGGCLDQDYAYAAQVRAKEQFLSGHYGREVRVVPCPDPLEYRNRMDFVQAFGKSGLRKRGKFAQVVDVKDCLLIPGFARDAYNRVRALVIAHNIQDYNYVRHDGFLKYIVVRTNLRTKDTMIILTTVEPDAEQETRFREFLEMVYTSVNPKSLWWTTVKGKADTSIGRPHFHLGDDNIIDEIAGRRFRIRPTTFFQANVRMAGELFAKAAEYAHGDVLDLYCGVGVISVMVAPNATRVVGVELNDESVAMARENAQLNGVAAEFHVADAAAWLAQSEERFDTVIVDPARPGLGKATCGLLRGLAPKRIIYISCNALTHKDDIESLSGMYNVALLEGYDLFPQTPHVEILSVLERKDSA